MNSAKKEGVSALVVFDIDGVIREVSQSYRRAIADTVEYYTNHQYRPTLADIDELKTEGIWNNDWDASEELIYRHFETQNQSRDSLGLDYNQLVAFFQSRYQGNDPNGWNGYITTEPLLVTPEYFQTLTEHRVLWGFFSGAMRAEADYALGYRLGLSNLVVVAMEDAPGKPNPTGLFQAIAQLNPDPSLPVFYVGDTVADMKTVEEAKLQQPERLWIAIGILPPHVQESPERSNTYAQQLSKAGAEKVFKNVEHLTVTEIQKLSNLEL